jgi:abelson tyrosine-protein kinase 1
VDDEIRCVISDFGQSEMKSEVWRVSGRSPPRRFSIVYVPNRDSHYPHTDGTLRWQAPELMAGGGGKFVASMDVYAFAMCSVEILNKGNLPWPLLNDDAVRRIVLSEFIFILL